MDVCVFGNAAHLLRLGDLARVQPRGVRLVGLGLLRQSGCLRGQECCCVCDLRGVQLSCLRWNAGALLQLGCDALRTAAGMRVDDAVMEASKGAWEQPMVFAISAARGR